MIIHETMEIQIFMKLIYCRWCIIVLDTQSLICLALLVTSVPHCHYAATVYFTSGVCAVNTEYCSPVLSLPLQHCILHREISYTQPQKYEHNLLLSSGVSVCGSGRQWI